MKKHFLRTRLSSVLLLFIFFTSCHGQNKTVPSKDTSNQSSTTSFGQAINNIDPYFIESTDTFATHGPQNITRNILQDKNGNIWFASWQGIICYDGKIFTNYTLKNNLIHFHVFSILEDKSGNLWFGTIRGGVYKYDGKNFTLYTTKDGLADNAVTCMMEDLSGNIWFGTDSGASRYDPRYSGAKKFTNTTMKDGLVSNHINAMLQDKNGIFWFGTDQGITCSQGIAFVNFNNQKGLAFHNVRSIIEDKKGILWFGSEDGLCRYDGSTQTIVTTNFIGNIFEDKIGNLWLSEGEINLLLPNVVNSSGPKNSFDGMAMYRYDGKSSTMIMEKMNENDNQVFGITEDKDGNIWFGTMNGVYRYDPSAELRTGSKSFNNFVK